MNVTEADVEEIKGEGGIKCKMSAANHFETSGRLTLKLEGKKRLFYVIDQTQRRVFRPTSKPEKRVEAQQEYMASSLGNDNSLKWPQIGTK